MNSAAQREGKSADWRPLGFYSEKLEPAQLSYCAFYRELCTIFSGICHFRLQLEDRWYTIWTDQKPLTFALSYVSDCWTARKQRQLFYIAEFTADIVHVTGTQNIVVDLMSRPPQAVLFLGQPSTTGAPHHLVVERQEWMVWICKSWPESKQNVLAFKNSSTASPCSYKLLQWASNSCGVTSKQATGGH